MTELDSFIAELLSIIGTDKELNIEQSRKVILLINKFLFSKREGLGTVEELGDVWPYLSPFHKYWNENAERIINPSIDEEVCLAVARIFLDVYRKTNGRAFVMDSGVIDRNNLSDEEVCRVRMLTANQDFRGSRVFSEFVGKYEKNPLIFDVDEILSNPEAFLSFIDVLKLSQTDKRKKYALGICNFVKACGTKNPYDTIGFFNDDLFTLRQELIKSNAGFGEKKADMFIRDMVVSGVWKGKANFDKIDVASDINTMKIALRTGILKTSIPLVSSFLDIFSPQYGLIEKWNAKAWRCVWEKWKLLSPTEVVDSPCMLDFFVYRTLGKEICKPLLTKYKCKSGHTFQWNSKRLKKCMVKNCKEEASVIYSCLPCEEMEAIEVMKNTVLFAMCDKFTQCPLKPVCDNEVRKKLNPPKSISILGATGWESAYVEENAGGGGLMS